jgi:hypothetical protein
VRGRLHPTLRQKRILLVEREYGVNEGGAGGRAMWMNQDFFG